MGSHINNKRAGIYQVIPDRFPQIDKFLVTVSYIAFVIFVVSSILSISLSIADKPIYRMLYGQSGQIQYLELSPVESISSVYYDENGKLYVYYPKVGAVNIYDYSGTFEASVVIPTTKGVIDLYPQISVMGIHHLEDTYIMEDGTSFEAKCDKRTVTIDSTDVRTITRRSAIVPAIDDMRTIVSPIMFIIFIITAIISNILEFNIQHEGGNKSEINSSKGQS